MSARSYIPEPYQVDLNYLVATRTIVWSLASLVLVTSAGFLATWTSSDHSGRRKSGCAPVHVFWDHFPDVHVASFVDLCTQSFLGPT